MNPGVGRLDSHGLNSWLLNRIVFVLNTPPKTNMTMEITTMNEDVSPIENRDFPASHLDFQGSSCFFTT